MSSPEAEFADLTDFILRITQRIWEERHVEDIRKYYTADCRGGCAQEGGRGQPPLEGGHQV